jgi:RNAse (barnase) inhibitor barstar
MTKLSNNIRFINSIDEIAVDNDAVLFRIDGALCEAKANLFDVFAKELSFPPYFGRNWDAFDECLFDMEWIRVSLNKHRIYIHIYNLNHVLKNEDDIMGKRVFYEIINEGSSGNGGIDICFLLLEKERGYIENII